MNPTKVEWAEESGLTGTTRTGRVRCEGKKDAEESRRKT